MAAGAAQVEEVLADGAVASAATLVPDEVTAWVLHADALAECGCDRCAFL
jgi:hypothetical protein